MGDEVMIDAAEMRTAVGTCIKDPDLQRLFKSAPDGAREVIKLSFFSTVFPEKMDANRFQACLRAIEPDLTSEDLRYLIRYEDDPGMRSRFVAQLAEREKGIASASGPQGASPVRKLHVRREESRRPVVDLNAEAMKRNLAKNELERQENEARRIEGQRLARRSALLKTGVSVLVGLVILAGGAVWLNVRSKRQRAQASAAREMAERMRMKESIEREERERRNAELQRRQEEERAARQTKLAAERAEQAIRQEKHEKEVAERRRKIDELEKKRNEIAERVDKIREAFNGVRLYPWSSLPKTQRPGAVERTFLCLVPAAENRCGCYEVRSQTNGVLTVVQLAKGEDVKNVDLEEWSQRLETFGGLIHNGTVAYLFLPKQAAGEIPWKREGVMPSQMRLGELTSVIRMSGMNTEAIAFDVRIRVPGVMKTTTVGVFGLEDHLGCDQIEGKVRDVAATKVKKQKPKGVRRTMVLYEGTVIKRQMNGVTLLPRNPLRITNQYLEMRSEALRQEQACLDAEREAEDRFQEQVRQKCEDMLNSALISVVVCPRKE